MITRFPLCGLSIVLLIMAGAGLAPGQELPGGHDGPVAVADFADLSRWKGELPSGVTLSAGPAHTARLEWKSKTADATHPATVRLKLAQAVLLPTDARRAGLWLYVQRPMYAGLPSEVDGVWLMLRDADGRAFQYRLAKLSKLASGWRYIDSFSFGTNETRTGAIPTCVRSGGLGRNSRPTAPSAPSSIR